MKHFIYEGGMDIEKAKYDYPKSFFVVDGKEIHVFEKMLHAEQYSRHMIEFDNVSRIEEVEKTVLKVIYETTKLVMVNGKLTVVIRTQPI